MTYSQISFVDEIIVDNFAGGGGASTGIELATGRPVTIAINHDPDAILMHLTAVSSFTSNPVRSALMARKRRILMRLIDADAVHSEIENRIFPASNLDAYNYNIGINDALNEIEDAETIDAIPVVRCKDCEYFVKAGGAYDELFNLHEIGSYCGRFFNVYSLVQRDGCVSIEGTRCWCSENDFCSKAEKKEEAE